MNHMDSALLFFGALLLVLGLTSGLIKNRWHVSEPAVALAAGIIIGPQVLDWFDLAGWGDPQVLLRDVARLTLSLALLDVALTLPTDYIRRAWRSVAAMLGLVMPAMWLVASVLAWSLLDLPWLQALILGAVLTPTDPVVASSIVSGKLAVAHVPERIRHLIACESGANDALALPLLILPLLLLTLPSPDAWSEWLIKTLLWDVLTAALLGAAAGYLGGRVLVWAQRHPAAEHASLASVSLALALTAMGGISLMGGDGLLAAFTSGLMLNRAITGRLEAQKRELHETMKRFFEQPVFALIGMQLPWAEWQTMGGELVLFAGGVLLLRRLPVVALLRRVVPAIQTRRDMLFVGWFGPIGVAALYYAMLVQRTPALGPIWTAASLVIAASVLLHGTSATYLTGRYGAKMPTDGNSNRPH
ncbi:MAG: cation:proton antiporter [Pseudomonadales bacterium]|jgi:NhaP-type Na+/H+ or K+/H+ antiporter